MSKETEGKKPRLSTPKIVISVVGIVLGLALAAALPASGLTFQTSMALGILAWAVVWWIASPVPEYIVALIMAALFVVVCGVPTETVFTSFAGSTWWLLVAAFGLGLAMQKCGLMKRMALAILHFFPNTYKAQVAGFLAAGTLIGPFIPSLSAKAILLAPISLSVSDHMGFERKSKQADGLFLAMFTGIRTVGPAVISASVLGYAFLAVLPADVANHFDMLHWFLGMLPWFVFVMVLNYVAIVVMYGPKDKGKEKASNMSFRPRGEAASNTSFRSRGEAPSREIHSHDGEDFSTQPSASLEMTSKEPMSKHEKQMAVIMSCCVIMWVTQPLHNVPAHIVALGALVATCVCGVLDSTDLRKGIAWDNLIFMGIVFGLGAVFAYLGIDAWLVELCKPIMASLAGNPYLLVIGISLVGIALRFVIISEIPYLNIFMAFMVPLAVSFGINPWVVAVCVYATFIPWFAKYQNIVYMAAYYAVGGKMVGQAEMAKYCAVYLSISTVGLLISVPYWQFLGLM